MKMIRHLVLLSWRKEADPKEVRLYIERLNRLPDECEQIYNWYSGQTHTGPDQSRPLTHDFCFSMDFVSREEQSEYSKHPSTVQLHDEAISFVDLEGVVSIEMFVEAESLRKKSCF